MLNVPEVPKPYNPTPPPPDVALPPAPPPPVPLVPFPVDGPWPPGRSSLPRRIRNFLFALWLSHTGDHRRAHHLPANQINPSAIHQSQRSDRGDEQHDEHLYAVVPWLAGAQLCLGTGGLFCHQQCAGHHSICDDGTRQLAQPFAGWQ